MRIYVLGSREQGSGFRVHGIGFRVWGLGFIINGVESRFQVIGLGFGFCIEE